MNSFSRSDLPQGKFKEIADSCYQHLVDNTGEITAPEVHSVLSYMIIRHCLLWNVPPEVLESTSKDMITAYKMLFDEKNKVENDEE